MDPYGPTFLIRDAGTLAVNCRPPAPALTVRGRWKQSSSKEATHLHMLQVIMDPHGIAGFKKQKRRDFIRFQRTVSLRFLHISPALGRDGKGALRESNFSVAHVLIKMRLGPSGN